MRPPTGQNLATTVTGTRLCATRRGGFTLIEVLIVVSIILLLIGLLLPALGMVRGSARDTMCMSNLRQTGITVHSYVANNRGVLPFGYWNGHATDSEGTPVDGKETDWSVVLNSYIKGGPLNYKDEDDANASRSEIFQCPLASRPDLGMNHYTSHPILMPVVNKNYSPYRLVRAKRTSEVVLIMDSSQSHPTGNSNAVGEIIGGELLLPAGDPWYNGADTDSDDSIKPGPNVDDPTDDNSKGNIRWRHRSDDAANFVFVDGHAELMISPEPADADGGTAVPGTGTVKFRHLQADK